MNTKRPNPSAAAVFVYWVSVDGRLELGRLNIIYCLGRRIDSARQPISHENSVNCSVAQVDAHMGQVSYEDNNDT